MIKHNEEIRQLIEERDRFIQQANERIAWYNGRIHQLQKRQTVAEWWKKLRIFKHE